MVTLEMIATATMTSWHRKQFWCWQQCMTLILAMISWCQQRCCNVNASDNAMMLMLQWFQDTINNPCAGSDTFLSTMMLAPHMIPWSSCCNNSKMTWCVMQTTMMPWWWQWHPKTENDRWCHLCDTDDMTLALWHQSCGTSNIMLLMMVMLCQSHT